MLPRRLVLTLFAFLSVLPRLFHLKVPFERDEGVYAYIADAISRGKLPYLDAFDNKSPGIYYLYDLSFKLFGHEVYAPRILAVLFMLAAVLIIFRLVYRLTESFPAGLLAMVFLGLATSSPVYTGFNANTEIFTVPLVLGALLLLSDDDPAPRRYLWAGLLFGCALMLKQSVIPIAVFSFAASILRVIRDGKKLLANTSLYAMGGALPLALFTAYFAASHALNPFLSGLFLFNFGYMSVQSANLGWPRFLEAMGNFLQWDTVAWLAGLAGSAAYLALSRDRRRFLVAAAMAGAAASVAMGKYFTGHYFIFFVPFLALGVGLGTGVLATGTRRRNVVWGGWLLAGFALITQIPFFGMSSAEILKQGYGSGLFTQTALVGDYLKRSVRGDRSAYIIGAEPEILFYAGLTTPTRFFYPHTLMVPATFTSAFRREALADLERAKPAYLVVVRNPDAHFPFAEHPEEFYRPLHRLFARYQLQAVSLMYDEKLYGPADVAANRELLERRDAILVFARDAANPDQSLQFQNVER